MYFLRTLRKSNKREETNDVKGERNGLISRKKQELTMVSCATEQNEEIQKILGRATQYTQGHIIHTGPHNTHVLFLESVVHFAATWAKMSTILSQEAG